MEIKEILKKLYISLWIVLLSIIAIFLNWGFTSWKQWLDLAWWVRLLYFMDFSQYKQNYKDEGEYLKQKQNVLKIVERNIDRRISKLWVSDYNARYVYLWWKDYMEVEIWWISDVEKAKKIIWKTVQMTFKVPFEWTVTPEIKKERQLLAEKILELLKEKWMEAIMDYIYPETAWNITTMQVELTKEDMKKIFNEDIEKSLTGGYIYPKLVKTEDSFDIYQYVWKNNDKYMFLKISVNVAPKRIDAKYNNKLLNGERFKMATVDRTQAWQYAVNIQFDDEWRLIFCNLTKKYLHKPMAIFIWNRLVTDPVIQSEICWGVAQITWRYTKEQANKLAEDLNTWAMPVMLKLEQEEKVSPLLWQKAFRNAIIAAWLGIILIFVMFLFIYWFKYAIVTLLSLGIFFITLWWVVKLLGIVLSLSAIWAIILNIGMAVDANVIIYERIREELKKGASWIGAVISGYKHSLSAIRDGNLTTWLIAFLLFLIWTNIFKWFGTMMIINILIVLFVMVPAIPGLLILSEKFFSKKSK